MKSLRHAKLAGAIHDLRLKRNGRHQVRRTAGRSATTARRAAAPSRRARKTARERSNGHDGQNSPGQQKSGDREQAKEKNGDQNEQKDDEKKDQPKNEDEKREWPKPPLKVRVRTYVNNHRKGVLLGVVGFLAATFLIILLVLYLRSYESTDDAQVDGHLNSISPRISGTVTAVYVENNQNVTAGQLLAELDARDYATALAQARAANVQAEAQLRAENPNVPIIETTNQTTIFTSGADCDRRASCDGRCAEGL